MLASRNTIQEKWQRSHDTSYRTCKKKSLETFSLKWRIGRKAMFPKKTCSALTNKMFISFFLALHYEHLIQFFFFYKKIRYYIAKHMRRKSNASSGNEIMGTTSFKKRLQSLIVFVQGSRAETTIELCLKTFSFYFSCSLRIT